MKKYIQVSATDTEYDWLAHAAKLRGLTIREYVVKAINASLRREGVDAVLFRERGGPR